MFLKAVVNVQQEVVLDDFRNVQVLTKGFFPSETSKVEKTEVVVTIKLEDWPNKPQLMFLDHLRKEGVIGEYHTYEFDGA